MVQYNYTIITTQGLRECDVHVHKYHYVHIHVYLVVHPTVQHNPIRQQKKTSTVSRVNLYVG